MLFSDVVSDDADQKDMMKGADAQRAPQIDLRREGGIIIIIIITPSSRAHGLASVVILIVLSSMFPGTAGAVAPPSLAEDPCDRPLLPRGPIRIDGADSLALPTSGIVAGSGTAEDPFLICGWIVQGGVNYGAEIKNVDAHIVFKHNVVRDTAVMLRTYIHRSADSIAEDPLGLGEAAPRPRLDVDAGYLPAAVKFENVGNVRVENVSLEHNTNCARLVVHACAGDFSVSSCDQPCYVLPAQMSGLVIFGAGDVAIDDLSVEDDSGYAILVLGARSLVLSNSEAASAFIITTPRPVTVGNAFERVLFARAHDALVESNVFGQAATILESDRVTLRGNAWTGQMTNPTQLTMVAAHSLVLEGNVFRATRGDAIVAIDSTDATVRGNDFTASSGYAVRTLSRTAPEEVEGGHDLTPAHEGGDDPQWYDGPPVDARHNWWGCADGPGSDGCARVQGPVAFEPFATRPFMAEV